MLFPFGPHRLYPSFVASVSLLLISMLVPKAGGAKGPALRLRNTHAPLLETHHDNPMFLHAGGLGAGRAWTQGWTSSSVRVPSVRVPFLIINSNCLNYDI